MSMAANQALVQSSEDRGQILALGGMLAVMGAAIAGFYWPTIRRLVPLWMNWESDFYGTVFLILPISLYFVWERRQVLAEAPRYQWAGMCLVGLLALFWWVADVIAIVTLQFFFVAALVPAGVWAVAGYDVFKRWLFPLGLLFFTLPFADFLVPILQDVTAWCSVTLLQWSNIPVYLEGWVIVTPQRHWVVKEACSGVRWVMASAMFGYLYSGMYLRTWGRRIAFMTVAALLPVVTNGLRAYVVPLLDYVSSAWIAQGIDDFLAGWLFFGVIILVLVWLGARLQSGLEVRTAVAAMLPTHVHLGGIRQEAWGQRVAVMLGTVILLGAGPLWVLAVNNESGSSGLSADRIPQLAPTFPWSESRDNRVMWRPAFNGHSAELFQSFELDGRQISMYVAYYPSQRQNAEAISEGNSLYDPSWESIAEGNTELMVDGQRILVRRTDIRPYRQDQGAKRVVLSWYWIDHTYTASSSKAKLLQLASTLLGHSPEAAGIILSVAYLDNPDAALESIQRFVSSHPLTTLLSRFSAAASQHP